MLVDIRGTLPVYKSADLPEHRCHDEVLHCAAQPQALEPCHAELRDEQGQGQPRVSFLDRAQVQQRVAQVAGSGASNGQGPPRGLTLGQAQVLRF